MFPGALVKIDSVLPPNSRSPFSGLGFVPRSGAALAEVCLRSNDQAEREGLLLEAEQARVGHGWKTNWKFWKPVGQQVEWLLWEATVASLTVK